MADSFEDQEWVRTGVAAALIRSIEQSAPEALQSVATLLQHVLPNRCRCDYRGFLAKKLSKVSVSLGDDVLALEIDGHGALLATRVHTSRGIALKREEWQLEEWIRILTATLESKAAEDAAARAALEAWLGRS